MIIDGVFLRDASYDFEQLYEGLLGVWEEEAVYKDYSTGTHHYNPIPPKPPQSLATHNTIQPRYVLTPDFPTSRASQTFGARHYPVRSLAASESDGAETWGTFSNLSTGH